MTKPKTKYPIESFGPQLMEALKRGGRERVVIPFEGSDGVGKKLAHNFQRRIHTLRSRMREEEHPDYLIATRARVSILWGEKASEIDPKYDSWKADDQGQRGALIVIRPQDAEYEDALAKMTSSPLDNIEATPSPAIEDLIVLPRQKDELDNLLLDLDKSSEG